jgi:hypothetical protein
MGSGLSWIHLALNRATDWLLWRRQWTLGFHKRRRISQRADRLKRTGFLHIINSCTEVTGPFIWTLEDIQIILSRASLRLACTWTNEISWKLWIVKNNYTRKLSRDKTLRGYWHVPCVYKLIFSYKNAFNSLQMSTASCCQSCRDYSFSETSVYFYKTTHVTESQKSYLHTRRSKSKVKQSLYTPWRRLGGEEV